ncbi:mechanosensitive ion channel [Kiloniella laminariae]|uniref:Mechanosensitive ion channel n=1 Tax=Kiloniella laminariae TaxID=454162 RepID=A0ABT4LNS5_9PROT|nr:mechanosensitive ion channel domain-containing protein [Kiloniella laminariae]MCZ4282774.1 mechanosensitive ion channel [Kiloniella laminariae]
MSKWHRNFNKLGLILLICTFLPLSFSASSARVDPDSEFDQILLSWESVIAETSRFFKEGELDSKGIKKIREKLELTRKEAFTFAESLRPTEAQLRKQIKDLGLEGETPELPQADRTATIKRKLESDASIINGKIKQTELIINELDESLALLTRVEGEQFVQQVFIKGPIPISPGLWSDFFVLRGTAWERFFGQLKDDLAVVSSEFDAEQVVPLWLIFLSGMLLIVYFLNKMSSRYGIDTSAEMPAYHKRVLSASIYALRRSLWTSVVLGLASIVLFWGNSLEPAIMETGTALLIGLLFFTITEAITKAALFPQNQQWRVIPISDWAARQIRGIALVIALIFSFDLFLSVMMDVAQASASQILLSKFFTSTAMALLIIFLHRKKLWRIAGELPNELVQVSALWSRFRKIIVVFMTAMIAAALLGFIPLSHYAVFNVVETIELLLLLILLHVLIQEVARYELSGETHLGRNLLNILALDEEGANRLFFWIVFVANCGIFVIGFIGILLAWGVSAQHLFNVIQSILTGFKIGEVRISLVDIAVAGSIFLGLLFVTKLFARFLEERLLPNTKLDSGVRNAIKASVGYAGLGLAVLMAVSVAGLDLSNLAIVAGALSVGIGFGLQSIVNNFVSGLILIFERPIKQGDWVVVGTEEGIVKKIKVRATEIETFDRASVIIPNSNLISGTMKNWTHKTKIGRISVLVGVSYDSDEEQVRDLLVELASAHPALLNKPGPYVLFTGFGASSLDFSLRAFLRDVEDSASVASDLRFAIRKAFREKGIEIPFPQHDLHIRTTTVEPPAAPEKVNNKSSDSERLQDET